MISNTYWAKRFRTWHVDVSNDYKTGPLNEASGSASCVSISNDDANMRNQTNAAVLPRIIFREGGFGMGAAPRPANHVGVTARLRGGILGRRFFTARARISYVGFRPIWNSPESLGAKLPAISLSKSTETLPSFRAGGDGRFIFRHLPGAAALPNLGPAFPRIYRLIYLIARRVVIFEGR